MYSVAVAAVLVALCSGATAAPITAYLRIDPSEAVLFPVSLDGAEHAGIWHRPPLPILSGGDDDLSRFGVDTRWAIPLALSGLSAGGAPAGDASVQTSEEMPAPVDLPEPPAILMSASGIGLAVAMLWRRLRPQPQRKRRRRRVQTRQMSPTV